MDKISEESKHQKDKDELLKSKIKDKIKIAQNKNRYMDTDFLDLREQEIIKNEIIKNRYQNIILYGGHERSERKVLIAYTEQYEYILENIYNEILNIIRIQNPKEYYNKYDHRTYLGALIKLGIKREKIGDIIQKNTFSRFYMIEAHLYYCFVFFIILLSFTGKNSKILKILSTFSWFLMTILTVICTCK